MPDYRRYRLPGGTYFFTVNLLQRNPNDLLVRHVDTLRAVVRVVRKKTSFCYLCLGGFARPLTLCMDVATG
jgi:putative transposase